MPLYEYECAQCHRRIEKIQKFSDPELTVCPHCNGALERTLTAPAVQFKGSGWYKDLYSSARPAAAGSSGESATASTPGESSGDSRTGARTDSAPAPASAPAAAPAAGTATSGSSSN